MGEQERVIEFRIDRHSGVSTYLQIVHQTEQALRLGMLEPGDKLPTAREVVEATAINPNTVLKAYRELERSGLVEARRGLGTFVRRSLGSAPADSPLKAELDDWARRAREAGLDRGDVAALFGNALEEHFGTASGTASSTASGTTTRKTTSTTTSTTKGNA
ncbi:GntR family transcriptional regulator [Streptomyces longispororuber]|uniref:GntR family transcriptional regulator n=1 Tax=Streptomyces longispororuber TaxID=68230 RepID=UPI00210996C4|nr:GntR family transcriptional regulator [Streptomyces longispororuber]MCQ4211306.1 GntR family transcriptional regulator [Streptomyces longispororuber]